MKLPIGRFRSLKPALLRLMARATALSASSCPTTSSLRMLSMARIFSFSPCSILLTEMPVQRLTILAIISSSTEFLSSVPSTIIRFHLSSSALSSSCFAGICPYSISAALLKSPSRLTASACVLSESMAALTSAIWLKTSFSLSNWFCREILFSSRSASSFSISSRRAVFFSLSSILSASFST